MKMKGFAMLGIGNVGWIEKDVPNCGPLDAIVKPLAVSPCTSDIHTVWEGAIGERSDMILGHEAVGEVVEVGCDVKSFKDGVFCEFFHVNEADANLAILPQGIDVADAVMLSDMVPTGFHGVELADVQFGDSVCVIGIGPVGLMAVAGAALRGASHLYGVGSRANCVAAAKEYGATDIINYKEGDIVAQIMDKTHGKGVDKVIIAGGDNDTFAQAIEILKPGGRIGNVNYLGSGDYIKIPRVEWGCGMGHKVIAGGLMPGGRLRMEKLVSLMETGRLDTSKLLTHKFNGFDHMEEALMLMKDKPRDLIKPVVIF